MAIESVRPPRRRPRAASKVPPKWLTTVAKELLQSRGRAVIVVGSRQPPEVHALVHAINAGARRRAGAVVSYAPAADPDELDVATRPQGAHRRHRRQPGRRRSSSSAATPSTTRRPTWASPTALGKVPFSVHASLFFDETSEKCTWHVPARPRVRVVGRRAGARRDDQRAAAAHRAALRGPERHRAARAASPNPPRTRRPRHEAVRATARDADAHGARPDRLRARRRPRRRRVQGLDGQRRTRARVRARARVEPRARDGRHSQAARPASRPSLAAGGVAAAIDGRKAPARGPGAFEVTFAPCPKMVDGRYANNTWLQELPDRVTKLVWDNAAIVSPATREGARRREQGRREDHRRAIARSPPAVWIVPGQADHSIALTLGLGPQEGGPHRQRPAASTSTRCARPTPSASRPAPRSPRRATSPTSSRRRRSTTRREGRPIAHEATLAEYRAKPNFAELDAPPPRALPLWTQAGLQQGPPVGDDDRPQRVHGLQRLRHRVHGREQRPRRRQARGLARPRDALAPHRPLLRRARRDRRDGGGPGGHLRAAHVRALRGGALRERLPGRTPRRTAPRG